MRIAAHPGISNGTATRVYDGSRTDEMRRAAATGATPDRGHFRHLEREVIEKVEAMLRAGQRPEMIAEAVGCGVSTVYRERRRLGQPLPHRVEFVVGHPFTPEPWWRVFGSLTYGRLFGDAKAAYSAETRHRLRSPVARPVPDSVVSPVTDTTRTATTVERGSAVTDDTQFTDMMIDLRGLIARGLPDDEIARRLELDDPGLVTDFRRQGDELRELSR